MEKQILLSLGSEQARIEINQYQHYANSVGNNLQSIQITTKYRYQMLKQEKLKVFCRVAIEEACKKHKIEIKILKVLNEHSHMIVNCPRTMSQAMLMQIIKGLSSYILFRLCPDFRKRYPRGHFWNEGYFCASCGSDFERAMKYIENQELHHAF
jgi:REP element-mobilizing transposase RayT